ncbi:MAG: prepilin-type N-terminal cleavage/methylation domain-containing protein [Deltaproteobacteria bacterium]|nr:prepilin-type N-terminal cleavage/methylation domain-containing protein [Deltaproteobacteria bacterium]
MFAIEIARNNGLLAGRGPWLRSPGSFDWAPYWYPWGFTLIELMVVIAMIATLAGIAIPVYSNQINKAKIFKAISDIKILQDEIDAYKEDNELPASLDDIGRGSLMDPWGNPYQYINHDLVKPGKRRKFHKTVPLNYDYDLFSMGKDGKYKAPLTAKHSRDDIVRADDGGYIGLASEY